MPSTLRRAAAALMPTAVHVAMRRRSCHAATTLKLRRAAAVLMPTVARELVRKPTCFGAAAGVLEFHLATRAEQQLSVFRFQAVCVLLLQLLHVLRVWRHQQQRFVLRGQERLQLVRVDLAFGRFEFCSRGLIYFRGYFAGNTVPPCSKGKAGRRVDSKRK